MKNLKNKTSTVPTIRTIAEVEKILADFGASNISKDYREGECQFIEFAIVDPENGIPLRVRMTPNVDAVYDYMRRARRRITPSQTKALRDQASRTAWKNIQELLHVQMSMLEIKQRSILQSFLSETVTNTGEPLFQRVAASGLLLSPPKGDVIDAE